MTEVWRVSLQRMRADWPIVAAAWLVTMLSAVLFAAGVIYPAAAAEAGLQRALRDAPVASRSLEIARYDRPANVPELDPKVVAVLQDVIARQGGVVDRDWRGSATLALVPGAAPGAAQGDQLEIGFVDGLAEHATLVSGAWPDPGAATAGSPTRRRRRSDSRWGPSWTRSRGPGASSEAWHSAWSGPTARRSKAMRGGTTTRSS